MYVIIENNEDGFVMSFHSDKKMARSNFETMCDEATSDGTFTLTLAEVSEGAQFGFGNYGEFYGGTVLEEFEDSEEYEEEEEY